MSVSRFFFAVIHAILGILAAITILFFTYRRIEPEPDVEIPGQYAQQIVSHENGDFVYQSAAEEIGIDQEETVLYIQNLLIVYTEPDLSGEEKLYLADQVDGTIVGDIEGCINVLQIRVEETQLAGLEALADILMECDQVYYAKWDSPLWLQPEGEDLNPWKKVSLLPGDKAEDLGNEDNPGGNDWWAEAVGAYTSWAYEDLFQDVTVGVLDSGFNPDHEDLTGSLVLLPGYTENTPSSHGNGVAGIMGAKNNEKGIRGLASGSQNRVTMFCADWSPYSNDPEDWWYLAYLGTGEYLEILKQMVEQGARVINNSWGFGFVPMSDLERILDDEWRWISEEEQTAYLEARKKNTAIDCLWLMIQLLENGEDVLFVQSAGNEKTLAETNGSFCSVTPEIWDIIVAGDDWRGVTYDDIEQRILIVAAVQNQRDKNGDYLLADFSNYGGQVDLCAPGQEIFTTAKFGYETTQGTSFSAPIVAGAAAVLWALDPSLEAPQVYRLLMDNTSGFGVAGQNQQGSYPMVNVGKAVESLLKQKGLRNACAVSVYDSETGEPVKNAEVALLDMGAYGIIFDDPSTDMVSRFGLAQQQTDSSGNAVFYDCGETAYPAYIRADGYSDWSGWLDCAAYFPGESEPRVNEVPLEPAESEEAVLEEKLEELADRYGVADVGTSSYTGAGGNVVPADRLAGLLCGDIHDYDGDGRSELLTVRICPNEEYILGSDWAYTELVLSVYEADTNGKAVLADEESVDKIGLTDTLRYSSVQLARGELDGRSALYLDSYLYFNSQDITTLYFLYDGDLRASGGVSSYEFEGGAGCDTAVSEEALTTILQSGAGGTRAGWTKGTFYDWEGDTPEETAKKRQQHQFDWERSLEESGLTAVSLRSMYDAPEVNWDPEQGADLTNHYQYFYDSCTLRLTDGFAMNEGGELTELCGILSPANGGPGTDLITYDTTGLLDAFR